jgi:hypothetical protein
MSIVSSVTKIGEALAVWLNPERREKAILRGAIESAEELMMILRKEGRYKHFSDKQLKEYEVHYQKRWNKWRDGVA